MSGTVLKLGISRDKTRDPFREASSLLDPALPPSLLPCYPVKTAHLRTLDSDTETHARHYPRGGLSTLVTGFADESLEGELVGGER